MSDKIIHLNEGAIKLELKELVRHSVEDTLNELMELKHRRRESSVEEPLIEMYLAGVSVRWVKDIIEALWGTKVSAGIVSNFNKRSTSILRPGGIGL